MRTKKNNNRINGISCDFTFQDELYDIKQKYTKKQIKKIWNDSTLKVDNKLKNMNK